MAAYIWINTGSGNDLLPHSTKPLPEPMLRSFGICLRVISKRVPQPLFCIMRLKIILLKLLPHLPGANDLTHWGLNKIADILHMMYSNAFSWKRKINFILIQISLSLLLKVQMTSQYWLRPNRHQAITQTNYDLADRHICSTKPHSYRYLGYLVMFPLNLGHAWVIIFHTKLQDIITHPCCKSTTSKWCFIGQNEWP